MRLHHAASLVVLYLLSASALPAADDQSWAAAVARQASPAVVTVQTFDEDSEELGQGSGFIVSSDGLIVTNYHVVKGAAWGLVKLRNGSFLAIGGAVRASLPLTDQDLIVLKCEGRDLPRLALGEVSADGVGRQVVAIGSPLGLESTVSTGVISALRELKPGVRIIQSTAPISPGSSGGPLLDSSGYVIGVNSAYLSEGQNLNFAVCVEPLRSLLAGLSESAKADQVALTDVESALGGQQPDGDDAEWPSEWSPPAGGLDAAMRLLPLYLASVWAQGENRPGLALVEGVGVVVEELSSAARRNGLSSGYLQSYLEMVISRSNVLHCSDEASTYVYLRVTCMEAGERWVVYSLQLTLQRPALLTTPSSFHASGKPVWGPMTVWQKGLIAHVPGSTLRENVTEDIDTIVVQLLNDVRKAHPPDADG